MKKILSITLMMFVIFQSACAGDVITHDTKRLPEAARKFISTYFTKAQVSHIKIESELFQTQKYEVLLTDRTEIDFDRHGEWLEVDCDKSPVPVGLIPPYVSRYMKENFPDYSQGDTRLMSFGKSVVPAMEEAGFTVNAKAPTPEAPSVGKAIELYLAENS